MASALGKQSAAHLQHNKRPVVVSETLFMFLGGRFFVVGHPKCRPSSEGVTMAASEWRFGPGAKTD